MYYVYLDEAGTSAKEPVTVVVGVIIHADTHWRTAQEMLQLTFNRFVPADLRSDFIFHAKDVWNGYRDQKGWSRSDRAALISAVAGIPRFLKSALAIGKVRRDAGDLGKPSAMSLHDFQHVMAFHCCVRRANKYVRDWGLQNDVATLVAEDVPDKRRLLKLSLKTGAVSHPLTPQFINLTAQEIAEGVVHQTLAGPIDLVVDTVHFVAKAEAPLCQIADACAFSFRRYFAGQEGGPLLVRAMLGQDLRWEDWQSELSDVVFSFDPQKPYPLRA